MKKLRNWNQWNANDVTVVDQNGFFHITENHLNLRPKKTLQYLLFYELRGEKGIQDHTVFTFLISGIS
jgi:hypothetical protein